MQEYVDRNDLMLLMRKKADYDSQPRACYRMIRTVRDFPPSRTVSEDVFLDLLNKTVLNENEKTWWKQQAGIA